jgi:hypothetical protein
LDSVVRPIRGPGDSPVAGRRVVEQHSRLLPSLFELQEAPRQITVLEVGSAIPETIRFLGQFRTRIHVADLYGDPLVTRDQAELSESEMKEAFRDVLNFPVGTLIDICLFWDFLNYLNRTALRAFSAALGPYLHPGTRGHGFSVLSIETPLRNQQYGIVQPDTLSIRPGDRPQLDYFPHSHEELNAFFDCFRIQRGWLLPDGRLEILLDAQV